MENMDTALVVLVTGLVVVFSVLILLTFIIKIYGTLVSKVQNRNTSKQSPKAVEKPVVQAPAKAAAPVAAPAVEAGIPGEVVAAIAAAVVSVSEEDNKTYAVKSIKRTAGSRPVWSMAGLMDNTRPF